MVIELVGAELTVRWYASSTIRSEIAKGPSRVTARHAGMELNNQRHPMGGPGT